MYTILAIIWVALRIKKRSRFRLFELSIVTGAVLSGVLVVARYFFYLPVEVTFVRLFFMFFSGAAFYVLKEYIILSHLFFWLFFIALLSSAIANKHAFFVVYTLTISYVLFYMAYIPSKGIRKYNLLGDYSYGVYIYAFPVQQTIAALVPGISVFSMLLIAGSATLILGALSWHLLEQHALGLKGLYVNYTKRILTFGRASTLNLIP